MFVVFHCVFVPVVNFFHGKFMTEKITIIGGGLAGMTAALAVHHLYIQHLPPGSVPSCGAPLDALLHMFPVTQVIVQVLRGGGECAKVDWTFLGLAMPAWVLITALVLGVAGTIANAITARRDAVASLRML